MPVTLQISAATSAELWQLLQDLADSKPTTAVVTNTQTTSATVEAVAPKRARAKKAEAPAATPAATSETTTTTAPSDPAPQSAPEPSAPKPPSMAEVRAAGLRFLEKAKETTLVCPTFKVLLAKYTDTGSIIQVPEDRRAEFIAECNA